MEQEELKKTKLTYRKYDAISVEGPTTAKNDKEFYQALFEENASDNGGYPSQSKGYIKNFFEDTHSLLFKKCEQHIANTATPVRIMAAKESVTVDPYYLFDKAGKELIDPSTGKQAIGRKISVFLMPDEDIESEIRRRKRKLSFVEITEEPIDNEAEKKEDAIKGKK